jgi:DNA-binding GntR family transcriptional regulator
LSYRYKDAYDQVRPAITLYEKTIDFIRKLIADRGLLPGDRLPSEVEIAAMTGVSLMTVRRAMSELANAGTLVRVQGRGTFVRSDRVQTESTIIGGLKATLDLQGVTLDTKLVSLTQVSAGEADAMTLSVPVGTTLWEMVRLRYFDGVPVLREKSSIPVILAPTLDTDFSPETQSLYETLATSYGLVESNEEQSLIVRTASPDESNDLGLAANSYVVEVTGVSISSNGTAFDCFEMVSVPEKFIFRLRSRSSSDPTGFMQVNE